MAPTPLTTLRLPLDERAAADRLARNVNCNRTTLIRAALASLAEQPDEAVLRRVAEVTGKAAHPQG